MKKLAFVLLTLLSVSKISIAQNHDRIIPSVEIKKLDGSSFKTDNIKNDGKPMIIDFWATCFSP